MPVRSLYDIRDSWGGFAEYVPVPPDFAKNKEAAA